MTIKASLVSNGMPPRLAGVVGGTIAAGLTALGLSQASAAPISWDAVQIFTTVASGKGARFSQPYAPSDSVIIINEAAKGLTLYPASGGAINGGSVNASVTVSAGTAQMFGIR